jgi:biopolymer transport protein ExbD
MNFRKRQHQEPEINLIPFIDVLLVVLIFLMLTTSFTKFTEVQLKLPVADTEAQKNYPHEVVVKISSEGAYWINEEAQTGRSVEFLGQSLQTAAQGNKDAVIIISADAMAPHQSVMDAMVAAQSVGLGRLTFAAKPSGKK